MKDQTTFPEYVNRNDVALALQCSPRSISRVMKVPQVVATERIPFKRLVKALGCEPQFLADCMAGRDQGIPMFEAAALLGIHEQQLYMRHKRRGVLPHVAMLPRGVRFSRNAVLRLRDSKVMSQPKPRPEPNSQPLQNEIQRLEMAS